MTEIKGKAEIAWGFVRDDGKPGTVDGTPTLNLTGNATCEEIKQLADGSWKAIVVRGDGSSTDVSVNADVDLASGDDHKIYQDFFLASLVWLAPASPATQVADITVNDLT